MKKNAFIFPGQGAQYPGMGKDFFEHYQEAREVFEEADDLLGQHFSKFMFEADVKSLALTKNAQPALYIHSHALLAVLRKNFPQLEPKFCLGLSLGEYSAIAAAKKMSFASGLKLVAKRGELMQKSAEKNPGTMAAVLPATEEQVAIVLKPFQEKGLPVFIANLNSPGQVVIAGAKDAIEAATMHLKEAGAKRVLFLEVSGAFHTPFMQEAKEGLEEYINSVDFHESEIDLIMNVTGKKMATIHELKQNLIKQVTAIVYWQKSIEEAIKEGCNSFIEIGAGKTLTNMNKKIHTNTAISFESVADLEVINQALNNGVL